MPDINLLKNTERIDPVTPRPLPPTTPGPLSDPTLEKGGLAGAFRALFSRRPKIAAPITPTLGKAMTGGGKMTLGHSGVGERILNEKKSKPTMIQLPDEAADGFNINLLGQDLGVTVTLRRQLMKLGGLALGTVVVVGLLYLGLTFYAGSITSDIDSTTAKINVLKQEISDLQASQTEVAATTKKITAIRSLIDRHVHWTKFFAQLEAATSSDVFYGTSFTGDLNGTVTLAARAPSFDAVATQYLFYHQAVSRGGFIQSFDITGATQQDSKTGPQVSFTVSMQLVPTVFYLTAEEASAASVPSASAATTTTVPTNTNSSPGQ